MLADLTTVRRCADRKRHASIEPPFLYEFAAFCCSVGLGAIFAQSACFMGRQHVPTAAEIIASAIAAVISLIGVWQAVWRSGDRTKRHKSWSEQIFNIKDHCTYKKDLCSCNSVKGEAPNDTALFAGFQNISSVADFIARRIWHRSIKTRHYSADKGI